MPIYRFSCNKCGKDFDKVLASSDISAVTCRTCHRPAIKKILPSGSSLLSRGATPIPAGALSGSSCKSGFS
ncbi:MAG: zinc ribbon domain-containing protein [Desulforhopalus sp.]|nr:zinc ribbon domain-containing protein [Desulforhopalus sp.]